MTQYTIYALTCTKEGRAYIGCTENPRKRIRKHLYHLRSRSHSNGELQTAFNRYPFQSFKVVVLVRVDGTLREARQEEARWIAKLEDKAYNIVSSNVPIDPVPEFDVHQIMDLVRQGLSDPEIASRLNILPIMAKTVRESPMREYL